MGFFGPHCIPCIACSGSSAHKKQEVKQQGKNADAVNPDKRAKKPVREEEGKLNPDMQPAVWLLCCSDWSFH